MMPQRRQNFAVITFFLVSSLVQAGQKSKGECELATPNINFKVVHSINKDNHVPFFDIQGYDARTAKPKRAYLLPGDLVTTDEIGSLPKQSQTISSKFICAEYRNLGGKTVRGWLPAENLLQVVNFNQSPEDYLKTPDSLMSLLKSLPVKSEILPSQLWHDGKHGTEENPFDIKLARIGETFSVEVATLKPVPLANRIAMIELTPTSSLKCGMKFLLFNNALLVIAEVSGVCWGNHGESNPDGAYYVK